jgi:hypothetical protein
MATRGARTGTAPTRSPGTWPPRTSPPSASPPSGAQRRGVLQRALRIRGARPKLACVKVSPVDAAREAGHPQMAWTLVARCSGGRPLPLPRGCGGLARPLAVHCYAPLTASSACRPLAGCVCAAGCRPPHARLATHASCADDVLSSRVLECCAVCLSVWRHRFLDMWLHHLISPFAASVCI